MKPPSCSKTAQDSAFSQRFESRKTSSAIPQRIIKEEEARGFKVQGMFGKRVRHFVDGVVVGNKAFVLEQIARLREEGRYKRRKYPIEQMGGLYVSLKAQRQTAM
jgi:hypothetical protein